MKSKDGEMTEEDKYYSETKKNGYWDAYNQKRDYD